MRIQASPAKPATLTPALVMTFAVGCGLAVGNIYYAQPLTRVIGQEFHVGDAQSGTIVTLTQLGYVCGLFLLAPWVICWKIAGPSRSSFRAR